MCKFFALFAILCAFQIGGYVFSKNMSSEFEKHYMHDSVLQSIKNRESNFRKSYEPRSDIFLIPDNTSNVKIRIYTSAFNAEIFALGQDTHLFQTEQIAAPGDEEHRIAIIAGYLSYRLSYLPIITQIALEVSNDTAHSYLYSNTTNQPDIFKKLFNKLDERLSTNEKLRMYYGGLKLTMKDDPLRPLTFADINFKTYHALEFRIQERIWKNPKFFMIVGRARFLRYAQTSRETTEKENLDPVFDAKSLLELESKRKNLFLNVQKAYTQSIVTAVNKTTEILRQGKYKIFDRALSTILAECIRKDPELNEAMSSMKQSHQKDKH